MHEPRQGSQEQANKQPAADRTSVEGSKRGSARRSRVIDDSKLLARIDMVLRLHAKTRSALSGPVLVHADLGLHNIALDPVSHRVTGLSTMKVRCSAIGTMMRDVRVAIAESAAA